MPRVGIDHTRGDLRIVSFKPTLEFSQSRVDFTGLQERLGATTPNHHEATQSLRLLELLDILHELESKLALVSRLLDVPTC